ncbi:NACHT domain-containing protein [Streptomyces collinus]|uniref:NACHT domain-containing protein n=1 Tax=Streptomyces collinus TaxID=42684 RepID=UPI0036A64262
MAILVIADDENKRGDLFNERMKDLVHALGFEVTRTNIHKSGREIDIEATHRLERRRAVIECKAKKEKIGGGDVNKFVGALDAERRPGSDPVAGYYISISGFTDSALEQETATGRHRVTLVGPQEVQSQLQHGRVIVSRESACYKAGKLRTESWTLDGAADLIAHESGWLWIVYFQTAGERKAFTLVHADGNFPSTAMGNSIAEAVKRNCGHSLLYIAGPPELSDADIISVRDEYFEYIASEYGEFTLEGFPVDQHVGSKSIELEELYVPQFLELVTEIDGTEIEEEGEEEEDYPRSDVRERHPLRQILSEHKAITVLGPPGSGKSTLVKRLATSCTSPDRRDRISDGLPDTEWLPLVIKCREIRDSVATIMELLQDIPRRAEMTSGDQAFTALIAQALRDGSALVLVDGLDEFSETPARVGFLRRLRTFIGRYPLCTVIVTSRETGFREVAGSVSERFAKYRISELNDDEIRALTLAWHKQAHGRSHSAINQAEVLAERIIETGRVRHLAVNPLLLTTLLLVQRWIGDLPRKRSVLYEKAIELLLMTWNVEGHDPLDLEEAKPHLAYLAYAMTTSGKQQVHKEEMLALFQEARTALPEVLGYSKLSPQSLLKRIELRSSLVAQVGHAVHNGRLQPIYEFKHLTFQEYLTAAAIAHGWHANAPLDGQDLSTVEPHIRNPRWHEVVALYGVLAGRRGQLLIELLCDTWDRIAEAGEADPPNDILPDTSETTELAYLIYQCLDDEVQAAPALADRALDIVADFVDDSYFDSLIASRYGEQFLAKARKEVDEGRAAKSPYIGLLARWQLMGMSGMHDPAEVARKLRETMCGDDLYDRVGALGAVMTLGYWKYGGFDLLPRGVNLDVEASISVCRACLPDVLSFTRDHHPMVRYSALWALAWAGKSIPFSASEQTELIPQLTSFYLDDPSADIRSVSGWALVEVGTLQDAPVPDLTDTHVEKIERYLRQDEGQTHEVKAAVFLAALSRNSKLIDEVNSHIARVQYKTRFETETLQFLEIQGLG